MKLLVQCAKTLGFLLSLTIVVYLAIALELFPPKMPDTWSDNQKVAVEIGATIVLFLCASALYSFVVNFKKLATALWRSVVDAWPYAWRICIALGVCVLIGALVAWFFSDWTVHAMLVFAFAFAILWKINPFRFVDRSKASQS